VALSDDEQATFRRLSKELTKAQKPMERLDAYYEGTFRLEQLGLAVPPELTRFVTVVNWSRVTADSIEQRCNIEGFRLAGAETADDDLWGIWQANDLDEQSQQGTLEALILTRSYICVGSREPGDRTADQDIPLVTVESPLGLIHETHPRSREVSAALRRAEKGPDGVERATLYFPDETVWLERKGRSGWVDVDRDEHQIGMPLVVPLVNRPRLRNPHGVSEIADVIPLTDAACRALTNAQVATETMAIPQRYVLGASPSDFVDQDGKPVTVWETYFSAVWAMQNGDAKAGQFSAADLSNFETIVNHYANLVSGVSGLPTRFYGQYTTNPPSEGSIVADEARLTMNVRRKHRYFGGNWETTMRLVRRIIDGSWNPDLARMETLWANPETPTEAQRADAVTKLVGAGILPIEAAWEELGYSATRRKQLKQMRDGDLLADPLTAAAEAFRLPPPPDADPVPAADAG
jgi:hypothetical protein